MTTPRYIATYCVMDTNAGASPFWHACIMISKQESENKPLEVVDCVGLYSQESTTTHPITKPLKEKVFQFKVDVQNTHGSLRKEKMRYLDHSGLSGIHFDISEKSYKNLNETIEKRFEQERKALHDANVYLAKLGIPPNGDSLYSASQELAKKTGQKEHALPMFHTTWNNTLKGVDTSKSHTCKNYALGILSEAGIITEEIKSGITGSKFKHAFPRLSAIPFLPMQLVSTGQPTIEKLKLSALVNKKKGYSLKALAPEEAKSLPKKTIAIYSTDGKIFYTIRNDRSKQRKPVEIQPQQLGNDYPGILDALKQNQSLTKSQENTLLDITLETGKPRLARQWGFSLQALSSSTVPSLLLEDTIYVFLKESKLYYQVQPGAKHSKHPVEITKNALGDIYQSIIDTLNNKDESKLSPEQQTAIFRITTENGIVPREHNRLFWTTIPPKANEKQQYDPTEKSNYTKLTEQLKYINDRACTIEEKLHIKLAALTRHQASEEHKKPLENALYRILCVKKGFMIATEMHEIPTPLDKRMISENFRVKEAVCSLNIAEMALNPERAQPTYYNFLLRAAQSLAVKSAILGILGVVAGVILIPTTPCCRDYLIIEWCSAHSL